MKKLIVAALFLAALAAAASAAFGAAPATPKIGLSFSDFAWARWKPEAEELRKRLEAKGFDVMVQEANHDANLQNDQVEMMVVRGCKVVIVVAEWGDIFAKEVDRFAAMGAKVIAYDRFIPNAKVAAYIGFEYEGIGREQAKGILALRGGGNFILLGGSPYDRSATRFRRGQMEVLNPLIDAGKVKIVADRWILNWDTAVAKKAMQDLLAMLKGVKIDAVVASSDGIALGALEALREAGLAGRVAISGQDATLDGCRAIAKGELSFSVLKDIREFWDPAADLAEAFAKGEKPGKLSTRSIADITLDAAKLGEVPCLFLPLTRVTKENMDQVVIASGFQTREDVYGEE